MTDSQEQPSKKPRRMCPHHATVTLKIDIRKMNNDGTLESAPMGNELLARYGMTRKAQLCLSGPTEAECIKQLKDKLEQLND
tara:strand:+ start:72 stop:317 length:246 start_codon:yes stop_codon:yes gene_type:complete